MASTVVASWSEIDCYRQCAFKHEHAYKQRWRSPGESPALAKGHLWHEVMEAHYLALKECQEQQVPKMSTNDKAKKILAAVQPLLHDERGNQSEIQALIEWMYQGYLEYHGVDPGWRIVAVEHASEFWLATPRGGRSRFKIKMKIDLIVREEGRLVVVDHKSSKDLPNQKMLDLNDQFGLYIWGLRKMGKKVYGAVHNAARTHKNVSKFQPLEERFLRTPMYRNEHELDTVALEAYRTLKRAYATPLGESERSTNPDTCKWKCSMVDPCLMSRKSRNADMATLLMDYGFEQNFERH